jgi:hypothetical protein
MSLLRIRLARFGKKVRLSVCQDEWRAHIAVMSSTACHLLCTLLQHCAAAAAACCQAGTSASHSSDGIATRLSIKGLPVRWCAVCRCAAVLLSCCCRTCPSTSWWWPPSGRLETGSTWRWWAGTTHNPVSDAAGLPLLACIETAVFSTR